MVGGVTPGKGGETVEGLPVFDTVAEAVEKTGADATMIFVPAAVHGRRDSGSGRRRHQGRSSPSPKACRCSTWSASTSSCSAAKSVLIGPNCPGVITPGECKIGIMPGYIHKPGTVGVMSRSGTLTYEAVWQLTNLGLGQSTCVGLGGDPIVGTSFIDLLEAVRGRPGRPKRS